jgi:hypothetical protein
MTAQDALKDLEDVSTRLAAANGLPPAELHRLIRLRGDLIRTLVHTGAMGKPAQERLAAIARLGLEAHRRLAVYRDSLRRQLSALQTDLRLLGEIKDSLPPAPTRLDLRA